MGEEINNEAADPRIHLSIERTELALERTHLAWQGPLSYWFLLVFAIDSIAEAYHQSRLATGKAFLTQTHIVSLVMVFGAMLLLISECAYYIKRSGELAEMRNQKKKFYPME